MVKLHKIAGNKMLRFLVPVAAVGAVTFGLLGAGDHVNTTTVALALLLIVLASATFFGRNPALVASFAAMLVFNFLFLPPVGTWTISDPENLVAWAAFTVTAIIAGELSSYARRRAREAERLYDELQTAFASATEAEAVKQSEKLKSALLDAVTHDLRTPLTSIKASVTTLLDSEGGHRTIELDPEGRIEFLNIINEETDRLNGFIEGMVELARVETGRVGSGGVARVDEVVSAAMARAGGLAGDHRFNIDISPDLPLIRADARAISEVVYSLLENAAKYSPNGSAISVAARLEDGSMLIVVNDQGQGIPPDMRERVFDKFVRAAAGPGGLGLGLAIARGLVESQNGSIRLEQGDNGVGTKAIVRVPVDL